MISCVAKCFGEKNKHAGCAEPQVLLFAGSCHRFVPFRHRSIAAAAASGKQEHPRESENTFPTAEIVTSCADCAFFFFELYKSSAC